MGSRYFLSNGLEGRRGWLRFWFFFLAAGAAVPGEQASGSEWIIMSWNVRNYLQTDRLTEDGFRPDYPKPETEKSALREVILEVHPDILFLQEIGGWPELRELQRDLRRMGLDLPYGDVAENADPERRLGYLAARHPPESHSHGDLNFAYFGDRELVKRGLQEVRFDLDGVPLRFYHLHLKSRFSKRDDDPGSELRRTREARAIRDWILEQMEAGGTGENFGWIVLGDFNDHRQSATVRRFLTISEREIGKLIPAEDSRGERWTHLFRAQDAYTRVDLAISGGRFSEHFEVFARIEDSPAVLAASDHRPLVLNIRRRPVSP